MEIIAILCCLPFLYIVGGETTRETRRLVGEKRLWGKHTGAKCFVAENGWGETTSFEMTRNLSQ